MTKQEWDTRVAEVIERIAAAARHLGQRVGFDVSPDADFETVHTQLMDFLMTQEIEFFERKARELGIDLVKSNRMAEVGIVEYEERCGKMTTERADYIRKRHYQSPFSSWFRRSARVAGK